MDYVVGSVAALITGNVTPNRPRLLKRALTPTKHQASPNVTPKSEFVEDRSIFLSPTMQKKKAIVKKSPKRIFQNPELDFTENGEGNSSLSSPMADKVKKHLRDELEGDRTINKSTTPVKSPKRKSNNKKESLPTQASSLNVEGPNSNETTPKKKKRKQTSESDCTENVINTKPADNVSTEAVVSPKKRKQRRKSVVDTDCNKENDVTDTVEEPQNTSSKVKSPKKQKLKEPNIAEKSNENTEINNSNSNKQNNKKRKKKSKAATETKIVTDDNASEETNKENVQVDTKNENQVNKENQGAKKKNKRRKKSKAKENKPVILETDTQDPEENEDNEEENTESSTTVNPNAITDKESDSEHESDDEIESENEEINKKVLEAEKAEASSEEDDEEEPKEEKKKNKEVKKTVEHVKENTEDEIKRTLFVGNVPFSAKCKKEIKKIFNKHGQIETIRIRTVPIKDGSYTPKLAVIKNELHPERTTVNVYIKYIDADSVEKALVENNTLLNENHLRVTRSSSTGSEHDPRCSVFIGNLPFAMEDEALRAKFEKCGEIHSVRIIRDKKTNAGKGFGYVNFESKDGVELALALTEEDLTVKNRILRVKRCTQTTNKKKPANNSNNQQKGGFRPGNQQDRGGFRPGQGTQRGGFRQGQGSQRGGFGQNQRGGGRPSQGNRQRSDFGQGNQVGQRGRFTPGNDNQQRFNKFDNQRNQGSQDEEGREGAFRRIMHKRKNQDGNGPSDGPPNKRANINQPNREKKVRKEFVGMTAEKKKKNKFDKGQKKKKALSEILTK